ncbi:MAG: hypothetical protein ACFCAD_22655 [Pleurocapsa sp.]
MIKIALILVLTISGCSTAGQSQMLPITQNTIMSDNNAIAQVTKVDVTGQNNSYTFAVTVDSPDTGCDRYADW